MTKALRENRFTPPQAFGHPPRVWARFGAVLLAAIWLALVVGLMEVVILSVRKYAFGQTIGLSPHYAWMAPVAYVLLFVSVVLVAGALGRLLPIRPAHVQGFLAFLGVLGILFMFPRLHRIAMLVLAAGAGVQAARVLSKREAGFDRLARRTLPVLAGVVLATMITLPAALRLRERAALAALPPARGGVPNVLLIILDTVRSASLSLYGYDRPTTPELAAFARRGVVFDRALAPSPWTLPSHASMFTGRWPHELAADFEVPFEDPDSTIAEVLAARGWVTAGFAGNPFYTSWEHGLDRGFVHYEDYPISIGQIINSASLGALIFAGRPGENVSLIRRALNNYQYLGRLQADDITDRFLDWQDGSSGRPFFAFLNYMDAHVPFEPPVEYKERFELRPPRTFWQRVTNDVSVLTPEQAAAGMYDHDRYDAAIAFIDAQLGRLFRELDRRGVLDETLVIVASDHGEQLGEKDLYGHANSLYMPLLHVPLVISFPSRVPSGLRVEPIVSLRHLPATIIDLIGLDGEAAFPGRSLAAVWHGETGVGEDVIASVRQGVRTDSARANGQGDAYSLVRADTQFIRNGDGSEEVYAVPRLENGTDLAVSPGFASRLRSYRERLSRLFGIDFDVPQAASAAGDGDGTHP